MITTYWRNNQYFKALFNQASATEGRDDYPECKRVDDSSKDGVCEEANLSLME